MKESALRDLIAQKISQLKPGLTLLQKEQYIPGKHGTKSFIDLYARDEKGRHVLIELKRSNIAARQALHEVSKYVEQVKQHFGVKDSEIFAIIASTEWGELLLPFSRFCEDAGFSIEGIQIDITEDHSDFQARPISPFATIRGRLIAPWHHIYWYTDKDALQRGIAAIERAYSAKGIDDYVIVSFYLPDPSTPEERRAALLSEVANMLKVPQASLSTSLASFSPPTYEYMAYTAVQMLPDETCLQIISCDESLFKEAQNAILLMPTEERARYLHECVASVPPFPECDYREIGYPAKFALFYQQEDGTILSTIRRGIFARNTLLPNSILYSELQGEDGFTSQKYKETVAMQDTAHVKKLQKDIGAVLKENPVWKGHLLQIIEEIKGEFPRAEITVSIFNPGTGIFTIYHTFTKKNGLSYLPCYYVLVRNPGDTRLYFGALAEKGPALTFSQLMKKYYHGSLAALLETVTWGGRDERDSYLVEDLGAQYQSYRFDILHGTATAFFTLQDAKWRPCGPVALPVLFQIYAEKNQSLVREILETIKPHDRGTFFECHPADP